MLPRVSRSCQQKFIDYFHQWVTLDAMRAKEPRISVRVNADLKQRIESITERTGVDEATLVRNCLEALCDHVERHGQISFPMSINANVVLPVRYPKAQPRHETLNEKPRKKP